MIPDDERIFIWLHWLAVQPQVRIHTSMFGEEEEDKDKNGNFPNLKKKNQN